MSSLSLEQVERGWGYVGRSIVATRMLLSAATKNMSILSFAGQCFPYKVDLISTRMKLFTAISIPFNLMGVKKMAVSFFDNMKFGDREGMAFDLVSFFRGTANSYDNITIFVNAVLKMASVNPMRHMATLSSPTFFALSSVGTICHSIKLGRTFHLRRSLDPQNIQAYLENKQEVIQLINKFISSDEIELLKQLSSNNKDQKILSKLENLQKKKKNEILRYAPKETVEDLEKLCTTLSANLSTPLSTEEIREVTHRFGNIAQQLKHKIKADLIALLANLFFISAFILFIAGNVGSLPFLLISSGLVTFMIHEYKK